MSDPILPWERLDRQTVVDHPLLSLNLVGARSRARPDSQGRFLVIDSVDWVNVVALTTDDRIVLIEQYRHGSDSITLEIPGGMVDPGEDFLAAGLRELREETGFGGGEARLIGMVRPNPAIQSNRCATVLVSGVHLQEAQALDQHEEIRVILLSREEVRARLADGRIDHALVVAAFLHLHLHESALQSKAPTVARQST